ncbi:hypothetical protein [Streptomyces sp. NRRL S-146]|uniref:hypothetical protein n=1 Tax=Streptomyces sp. NRRL S-146 TaxID=1463884 RepID=UPI000AFD5438|nr:hypothetical protein [Streptomyces sp. NRRL S-146]
MNRPARLRRLTVLAIGVSTAISLTACGSSGSEADGGSATPKASAPAPEGIVDQKTASSVVDAYEKANNKANATRDAELLGTVEAGQVHEQSKADYTHWPTWTKKRQKTYSTPFYYRDRQFWIPAASSGATWFAVTARSAKDPKDPGGLLIFDKVGGRYKMTAGVALDAKPKIAVDEHGLAAPADPSKKVGTLAPDEIGERYEDFFETGGKEAKQVFASTEDTRESTKVFTERNAGESGRWSTTKYEVAKPAHPAVYALRLVGGGVLSVFPTAHTESQVLKPAYLYNSKITPGPDARVYNPTPRIAIINDYQGQGLAELQPQKKVRVTELEYRITGSE